jgi:hypothetical protein
VKNWAIKIRMIPNPVLLPASVGASGLSGLTIELSPTKNTPIKMTVKDT